MKLRSFNSCWPPFETSPYRPPRKHSKGGLGSGKCTKAHLSGPGGRRYVFASAHSRSKARWAFAGRRAATRPTRGTTCVPTHRIYVFLKLKYFAQLNSSVAHTEFRPH